MLVTNYNIDNRVDEIGSVRKKKKLWQKVVGVLAAIVVFTTTYALIIPAITENAVAHCGMEEHTHTDECYGDVLVCELEEGEGHVHTDECYEIVRTLVCELEESEGHTHTEECYDEEGNLVCELEESEGHTHTDACYETEKNLVCELEECEAHTHTEECYEHKLVCELEEHTHCTQCYSDFDADLENEISWSAAVSRAKLTGDWNEDIIAVAKTQLGYTESAKNYLVSVDENDAEILKGYTRYGAWYNTLGLTDEDMSYADWNTLFVSFCIRKAEISEQYMPVADNAADFAKYLNEDAYGCIRYDFLNVKPGDIVFFDNDHDKKPDEAAVLFEIEEDSNMYKFIAGDIEDDTVKYIERLASNSVLFCYAELPVNPDYVGDEPETEEVVVEREISEETDEEDAEAAETSEYADENEAEDVSEESEEVTETSEVTENAETAESSETDESSEADETSGNEETEPSETEKAEAVETEAETDEETSSEDTEKAEETDRTDKTDDTEETEPAETEPAETEEPSETEEPAETEEPEETEPEETEEPIEYELEEQTLRKTASDGAKLTISGMIPVGAEAEIDPVVLTDEELIAYFGKETAKNMSGFVAYDIRIMVDGKEWQPGESVSVKVDRPDIKVKDDEVLAAAHVDGDTNTASDVNIEVDEDGGIGFDAEGFSVYIFYTVTSNVVDGNLVINATSDYGITVTLVTPVENIPCDPEKVSITAEDVESEEVYQLLDENGIESPSIAILDISLWFEGQEIEPEGTVTVSFEGLTIDGNQDYTVYHYDEARNELVDMDAGLNEDGNISIETDHFSIYVVSGNNLTEYTLRVGDTVTFNSTNSGYTNHRWSMPGADVADGQYNGSSCTVTGVAPGTVVLTHEYYNRLSQAKTEKITIHVISNETVYEVRVGETVSIPGVTAGSTHSWTAADSSIVSLTDSNKTTVKVKGESVGETTVNHRHYDTERSWWSSRIVNEGNDTYKVAVYPNGYAAKVPVGSTITLNGYADGSNDTWTVNNANVNVRATGNGDTANVTGISAGASVVTHTYVTKYGTTMTETFNITINQPRNPEQYTASFDHTKTIDYLADGTDNPDTDVDDNPTVDDYRLYLDMTGRNLPIDLLIVIDKSNSMQMSDNKDMDFGNLTNQERYKAINYFLNEEQSVKNGVSYTGFIDYFLSLNAGNQISVIDFGGNVYSRTLHYRTGSDGSTNSVLYNTTSKITSNYPYNGPAGDASVLSGWGHNHVYADCQPYYDGTNYEAALKLATDMFEQVNGDGNRKVMLFISDGVPTMFQIDQSDVGIRYGNTTIQSGDVGGRYGTGSSGGNDGTTNVTACREGTSLAIDEFLSDNPGVKVFSIGVSRDINGETGSSSPFLLRRLANESGGAYIGITRDMSELKLSLESIFFPKDVEIVDNLSKYVRFNGENPDVKVTMKETATGVETLLWDGTQSLRPDILTDVVYTDSDTSEAPSSSTGTVRAIFNTDYSFKPGFVYTLSFNVKTTQTAYNDYSINGENYGTSAGDPDTDYGTNATSSEQPGFDSNASAYVSYLVCGSRGTEEYPYPVVQVKATHVAEVSVKKVIAGGDTSVRFDFTMTITLDDESESEDFTLGNNEVQTFTVPVGSTIRLVEHDNEGYSMLVAINGTDMVNFSGDYVVNEDSEIVVTNVPGAVLPATGGSGTQIFYIAGIALAVISLAAIVITRRKPDKAA